MKKTYTLNELKVAVINRDLKKIEEFSSKIPEFSSIEEAKEFLVFIEKAKEILNEEKMKLKQKMNEIKKIKKFNQSNKKSIFNLTS